MCDTAFRSVIDHGYIDHSSTIGEKFDLCEEL